MDKKNELFILLSEILCCQKVIHEAIISKSFSNFPVCIFPGLIVGFLGLFKTIVLAYPFNFGSFSSCSYWASLKQHNSRCSTQYE
jgi:nitrate reductase NapE component